MSNNFLTIRLVCRFSLEIGKVCPYQYGAYGQTLVTQNEVWFPIYGGESLRCPFPIDNDTYDETCLLEGLY